jgi:hypothetical protein
MRHIPVKYYFGNTPDTEYKVYDEIILYDTLCLHTFNGEEWVEYVLNLNTFKLICTPFFLSVYLFNNHRTYESVIFYIKQHISKISSMEINRESDLIINFNDGRIKTFEAYYQYYI